MNRLFHYASAIFITSVVYSCIPTEEITVEYEQFDLGVDGELRSMIAVNDTFYFCGGSGWHEGWILKSTNNFQGVNLLLETDNLLFDLCTYNAEIYASSLGNALFGINEQGEKSLEFYVEDFQSIYALEANESGLYAVSGVNARTEGKIWKYEESLRSLQLKASFNNSLADLQIVSDRLLACGFGITANCPISLLDCEPDYDLSESFVAMDCINDSLCYAVAQSGGMAKTVDGGENWFTIRPADRVLVANVPFQDIEMRTDSIGYVCGRKGALWKTSDAGRSWVRLSGLPELDYFGMLYRDPYLYVSCAEGKVMRITD